ncbi:MAG: AAA family ATPase, partial [Moraxellaceae bacterium]|nr:AAA family ATPase [Moraxellaceae bacterium]
MSEILANSAPIFHLGAAAKYNPQLWSADELRAIFVARQRELKNIIDAIRQTRANEVPQHLLITGQRGMGKSTLLHRVALEIEDTALKQLWLPLRLPEEQYTVSTLAEFWANVLDALADALERRQQATQEIDSAANQIALLPVEQREEAITSLLESWCQTHQQRLVLLIDNTDMLFRNLVSAVSAKKTGDALPLWSLRKTLQHKKHLFWLGGSYLALETETMYHDAFLDFFHTIELKPLALEEMRDALLALAGAFGAGRGLKGDEAIAEMNRTLVSRPERLHILRQLTGGNPRTTVMLYELFAAGGDDSVKADLERLLDLMTPLYKARVEALADQPRKILAHIMEHWFPIALKDLSHAAGFPNNILSPQLKRLEVEEGLIERTNLPETRRNGYQVAERFFNIWYLMRYAPRRLRMRLTWLVEFMRMWYSNDELDGLAKQRSHALKTGKLNSLDDLEYSRAMAQALSDDSSTRYQLEWSVFCEARRKHENLAQLFDLSGEDKPYSTSDDYLRRLEALPALLRQCPHAKTEEEKQYVVKQVLGSVLFSLSGKEKMASISAKLTQAQYTSLMDKFDSDDQWCINNYGISLTPITDKVFLGEFFPDCPNAKLAYQQIKACFTDPVSISAACDILSVYHKDQWLVKAYRYAIERGVRDIALFNNLGNLQQSLKHYVEAEEAYRQAIALDTKEAYPWVCLGRLLNNHLDRYAEAEEAYRQAIALDTKEAY